MKEQKKTSSSTSKIKVSLTLQWEMEPKEYEQAKEFVYEQGWEWDKDPVTAIHFMNEICWPSLVKKAVEVD
jgi:hypothetical protein